MDAQTLYASFHSLIIHILEKCLYLESLADQALIYIANLGTFIKASYLLTPQSLCFVSTTPQIYCIEDMLLFAVP
jgi:hypothetical protein